MAARGVRNVSDLGGKEAGSLRNGWRRRASTQSGPRCSVIKHEPFNAARAAGVTICNGSDVGAFPHGDNAHESESWSSTV